LKQLRYPTLFNVTLFESIETASSTVAISTSFCEMHRINDLFSQIFSISFFKQFPPSEQQWVKSVWGLHHSGQDMWNPGQQFEGRRVWECCCLETIQTLHGSNYGENCSRYAWSVCCRLQFQSEIVLADCYRGCVLCTLLKCHSGWFAFNISRQQTEDRYVRHGQGLAGHNLLFMLQNDQ